MTPNDFVEAARVPLTLEPQEFGLWSIERRWMQSPLERMFVGWPSQTVLRRMTEATMHLGGEIVMEDSIVELSKHLPIWLAARGRVLITGLGLGCVVRGLLANPLVEHIDVVEIDAGIMRVVGTEFAANDRVTLHLGDALEWDQPGATWDYAWHDLHDDNGRLQVMHADLIKRFHRRLRRQGAWAFPRIIGRRIPSLLGSPGYRRHRGRAQWAST